MTTIGFGQPANRSRRWALRRIAALATAVLCIPVWSQPKHEPLPAEAMSAKTIFIDNQTGTDAVLETAKKEFKEWNRFSILATKENADLIAVFSLKNGLDLIGNAGFIKMEVFLKGAPKPFFEVKKSFRTIFEPQLRTKHCVVDFARRLEP